MPVGCQQGVCQYLDYARVHFEVFALLGRHVAPMGVKFGMEELM